ncbi:MAG: hypothetical protein N5P05_002983 [Chroococcopsis gigantea SAG 12.99]|jgi:hypothetical protein|nr:DUF3370 domain-containing protein [Chlorogloea purpurea SAG 13.99]MDV3001377.1 hypothetical protein [Chroococcopsis gigantea SAG 12.99]
MLSVLSSILLAQATSVLPTTERQFVTQYQEIRTLPGQLDDVMVFNSNSPEVVQSEGILLSTFPSAGKKFPVAHLNQALKGRFDVFTHHIARPAQPERTLYQGLLIHNPTSKVIVVKILQGITYLTSPDAPFIELPPQLEDPSGRIYSGPGSRLMSDILRRRNLPQFPSQIVVPPRESRMLFNLAIPRSSARSTFIRLYSSGPVYMANMSMYEVGQKTEVDGSTIETERAPSIEEWRALLINGRLVAPRDLAPTPPEKLTADGKKIYGRVAGVSVGSEWIARIVDPLGGSSLTIPKVGQAYAYPLSTVTAATFGTQQIQSAPMLVRYPDTALRAHGNYAVHYNLNLPLYNNTDRTQIVTLAIQTPLKEEDFRDRLFFIEPVQGPVFFRGAVRVTYRNIYGRTQERYFHLVQRQGQQGNPLVNVEIPPGEVKEVNLDFLYPPDATPPQVLSIKTAERDQANR